MSRAMKLENYASKTNAMFEKPNDDAVM
jgi:hypothetical protein